MSTNDLPDLLKRWAELEPTRCRESHVDSAAPYYVVGRFSLRHQRAATALALVQAAVQEAVEARGWRWTLDYDPDQGGLFAVVQVRKFCTRVATAPTAAVALLSAYMEAIVAPKPTAVPGAAPEAARPLAGERQDEEE
jgi:hypothetical protein